MSNGKTSISAREMDVFLFYWLVIVLLLQSIAGISKRVMKRGLFAKASCSVIISPVCIIKHKGDNHEP